MLCFWIAYILTRPLGASTGDLLSASTKDGGLGVGTITTSIVFFVIIAAIITYLVIRLRRDPSTQRSSLTA